MEIELIKKYRTQDREFGYNVLEGGSAPSIPLEVRKKMSEAAIGRTHIGHPISEETKRKIGDAQRGRKFTDEHRRKISEAKRGKSHEPPSEETRRKISEAHSKRPIYCYETEYTYLSVHECARSLGLQPSLVSRCCRGGLKTTGGYHLRYADNLDAQQMPNDYPEKGSRAKRFEKVAPSEEGEDIV